MFKKISLISLIFALAAQFAFSQAKPDPLLEYAKKELDRTYEKLSGEETSPYFVSYHIAETKTYRVTAEFGKILDESEDKSRILDIDLRVGDYNFDNTHIIRGERFSFFSANNTSADLPLDDDETAIRNAIWFASDKAYKEAIEKYDKALTNKAVKVQEEDTSADFSIEKAHMYLGAIEDFNVDKERWKQTIRELSARFAGIDWLYNGQVTFKAEIVHKYFVSSEGAKLQWTEPYFRIYVNAKTKADDGMSLPLHESYFAFNQDGLPDKKTIEADIEALVKTLGKLREAPLLKTTYSGPAILSGEAAGVFFHEIFGHRVEGFREKDPRASQTFKNSIDKKILPEFLDVIFDPTINELRGAPLSGFYPFDDEGVKAQKVVVAENGKFKSFLMSRSPIENFDHSNGHGRMQPGNSVVTRQSNLIVAADETESVSDLRDELIKRVKEEGLEYGLYFDVVQGGFTFTGRTIPNSFNVNPLVVYRVYPDGRPDEIIRGVDMIGTPLTAFSNIVAAADNMETFNGICGAESGGVPVSASSPDLLVSLIEVQKKAKSQAKPPILPDPTVGSNP